MHISIVQRIRNAGPADRLAVLVDAVCHDDVDDGDGFHAIVVERALHQMENIRFSVGAGYHLRFAPPPGHLHGESFVVISDDADGRVVKRPPKVAETGYFAYNFLRDYLGLSQEEPLAPKDILEKYPDLARSDINIDDSLATTAWCDTIAFTLLKSIRARIYVPA